MVSASVMSPIEQPRSKLHGLGSTDPLAMAVTRRRRKETVNERVEHILRGALRDAQEEALQVREGDPETRGRALQRSHQLASLYTTSTENKFLRSRAKRNASIQLSIETKTKRGSEASTSHAKSREGSLCAGSAIEEEDEGNDSSDDTCSMGRLVMTSPIKRDVSELSSRAGARMITSPIKPVKPWYSSSPTATLKEQIPPGITIDAKLHRYGARGTAKLLHGWRSKEVLEPLSTNRPVVPIDEFVTGLNGSPSFWPPEAFHPTGSRLRATMTRCPSSPIAISVEVPNACKSDNNVADHCQLHVNTQEKLQQQESQKLQRLYKLEQQVAREERLLNNRNLNEWQSRTLHFEPSSELAAHRKQQQSDPQLRHRRTQVSAIVQTPGYSPEKQRMQESGELRKKRFSLRWHSFARLLDAMRRTPCRRPVLQDMEKLFALARELGALNALGPCMLSRVQFTQLVTREFPLCELKHVNRLFSSYDCELRDFVDARTILGTIRAMRVQQGEPVELICASLRDFDSTGEVASKTLDETRSVVTNGISLTKALSLCCSSDEEERDMEERANTIWIMTLSWQRQILTRRLNGGVGYNVWKAQESWSSISITDSSGVADSERYGDDEIASRHDKVQQASEIGGSVDDEEDTIEEVSHLMQLVEDSRVPIRRIRSTIKRERETLALFTQQLLQRRHECLIAATTPSPR